MADQKMTDEAVAKSGPLSGVCVVDLTRVLAGPYCTMVLADLGARVIKVEKPGVGDDARSFGPFVDGRSAYFASLNRGKESIALDLKAENDRGVFERLLEKADVLVENFRPGVMEKLGYGWDSLHASYPKLVYAAVSGFGHTGPYALRPAYDLVVQGMGGMMSLTGHPGAAPARAGTSIGDITAGLFSVSGIIAALFQRQSTSLGAKVDISMLDCQVAILENAIARYGAAGDIPAPTGACHPSITPFDAFSTADRPIIVAAGNDALFDALCRSIERKDLAQNPSYASNEKRCENQEALKKELEATLAKKNAGEWLEVLHQAGVPCGPINTIDQVVCDPQVRSRNMIIGGAEALDEKTEGGKTLMAGNPIKMSGFKDDIAGRPAPALDENRDKINKQD
jgi:CoA:oxalate CoA-transferase